MRALKKMSRFLIMLLLVALFWSTAIQAQAAYMSSDQADVLSAVQKKDSEQLERPVIELTNESSTGKLKLTWKSINGAVKYEVYRAASKNGSYSLVKTTTATEYTDTTGKAGSTYYYKVKAIAQNSSSNSAYSAIKYRVCDLAQPVIQLSSVASNGKNKVSWEKIEGAVKYEVYRAASKNGSYSLLKTTTSLEYTDTTGKAGSTYYYKVRAIANNSAANSAYSAIKYRVCDLAQPVIQLSSVASSGKNKVSWEKIEGAVKYEVYRAASKNGSYSLLKTTTSLEYTDTTGKAGSTYYYKVRAIANSSAANSAYSAIKYRVCDLPRPITQLTAVVSSGKNKISWEKIEGAVKYEVYRAASKNGSYSLLKTTTALEYTDTSVKAGNTYYYKIRAIANNAAANSAYSTVKYRVCDLAQPVIQLSSVASSGKIKISWGMVEGAVNYEVYRADSKDGNYCLLKTTTSLEFTDNIGKAGNTYYYKVRALAQKSPANSAFSNVKYRVCDLARPVVSIKSNSNDDIVISWELIEGAKEYKVYRSTEKDGSYKLMATTSSEGYTDTSVKAGQDYYYKVMAIHTNTAANSAYSSIVSMQIDIATIVDEYVVAACALDTCYTYALYPSTITLERAYYSDKDEYPVVVVECSAMNDNGGWNTLYVVAVVLTNEEYQEGLGDFCHIIYNIEDEYYVACTIFDNDLEADYEGFEKLNNNRILEEFNSTAYS